MCYIHPSAPTCIPSLPVYLPYLSIVCVPHLSICLPTHLPHLSIYPYVCLSIYPSAPMCLCPFNPSFCPSKCLLLTCLSAHTQACPHLFLLTPTCSSIPSCLFVHLPVCPQPVYLPTCPLPVFQSICLLPVTLLSTHIPFLNICLSTCLPMYIPGYPSVYKAYLLSFLSVDCLSVQSGSRNLS